MIENGSSFYQSVQDIGSTSGESNPGIKALTHTICSWGYFSAMPENNCVYIARNIEINVFSSGEMNGKHCHHNSSILAGASNMCV